MIEKENREAERILKARILEDEQRAKREQIRKIQKKKHQQDARLKMLETKVIIKNNQILVPVHLQNGRKKMETLFLLDTGATSIVLFKTVALDLGISGGRKSKTLVVGGKLIATRLSRLDAINVGPITMNNASVLIIDQKGPKVDFRGLLGMNFLSQVKYTIDYANQVIRWQP